MRTRPVVTRFLAKRLWSSAQSSTIAGNVAFQRRAYERAVVIVRVYYALSVAVAVQSISGWPGYARLQNADPLWPAHWWFDRVGVRTGVNVIFCAYLVAAAVAVGLGGLQAALSLALEHLHLVGVAVLRSRALAWLRPPKPSHDPSRSPARP